MTEKILYKTALLFGAPGVGKGTQGRILGQIPGFFHLSCGDVFRSIDINSPDGKEIYSHTSQGQLVPDVLTMRIWRRGLEGHVALGHYKPWEDLLILDGIPRSVEQAKLLEQHVKVQQILHLVCPNEEAMIHRIRRRAIRENRVDDANDAIIRERFRIYRQQTEPVLSYYPPEMISEINSVGSPGQVLLNVLQALIPTQNRIFKGET